MEPPETVILMQCEGANSEIVGRRVSSHTWVFEKPVQLHGKDLKWSLRTTDRQPLHLEGMYAMQYAKSIILHIPLQKVGRITSTNYPGFAALLDKVWEEMDADVATRPYFASEVCGSSDRADAAAAGLVKDGEPYFQLQRNDAVGVFETDEQAIYQALQDEADGDPYAAAQLALAKTDLAVKRARFARSGQPW